ncbi:MAG TPA: hypothetical protein VGV12_15845 [Gemmatimonadales bacterium]|nr:hypothetical protein [Gemmatimonadales bacterium]
MSRLDVIHSLLLMAFVPAVVAAQTPGPPPRRHVSVPTAAARAADVASVDGVVKAYYDVISGPAGEPRQWSRDRSLYIPDLRFVATGFAKERPYTHVMDHQAFVDGSDSAMVHDGFFEREIHRVTRSYGNIVQVFSTYEEHRTADGPVQGRGVNALQLFWDGTRWWVASAIWFEEDAAHPIPPDLLP